MPQHGVIHITISVTRVVLIQVHNVETRLRAKILIFAHMKEAIVPECGVVNQKCIADDLGGTLACPTPPPSDTGPIKKYAISSSSDCKMQCYSNSNCQAWQHDDGSCFLYENTGAIALKDILQQTAWSSASKDGNFFHIRLPMINSNARNASCPPISKANLIIADISRPVPGNPSLFMSNDVSGDKEGSINYEFYYKIGTPMNGSTICNVQKQIQSDIGPLNSAKNMLADSVSNLRLSYNYLKY